MAKAAKSTGSQIKIRRGIGKTAVRDAQRAERKVIKAMPGAFPSQRTVDSYQNFAMKLGMGTDNALSASTYGFNPITRIRTLLEWIHRGTWIGGVAVDLVADDMTRAGIDLSSSLEPDQIAKLKQAAVRNDIWNKMNEGVKWSRLYGGSIVFMMIAGQDPATPLNINSIQKGQFKGLMVFDRWMVDAMIGSGDLVDEMGPDYGLPKFYKTISAPGVPRLKIHYSRVIRLEGIKLPYNQRIMEQLWGLSIIERIYDRMVNFDSATQGMAQLMYKAHYRVLKIKGLREIATAGGMAYQGLQNLVQLMAKFQGIEQVTLIDGDDEYEGTEGGAGGVAGVGEGLSAFAEQLAGALQIPLTRLFGQSPGGMNSSGDGELRMYYDNIKQTQESQLKTGVHKLYRVMAQSEGTPLKEDFDFEFKSLYQMTDQQQAEVSGRDTESVLSAHERGVISDRTALLELQQRGRSANRWSNITPKEINAADDKIAPKPELGELGPGAPKPINANMPPIKKPQKLGDRAWLGVADDAMAELRNAIENPHIDTNHTVVSGAVASAKVPGKTYVSPLIDETVTLSGKECHPRKYLHIHEQWERYWMETVGLRYLEAHARATRAEKAAVEGDGIDWTAYTHYMDGKLSHIEHSANDNPPPDPHIKPTDAVAHHKSTTKMHDMDMPLRNYGGMPIMIECFKGQQRWPGARPLGADYGHFIGTSSAEGRDEGMDCFVGAHVDHGIVYVIDQYNGVTDQFDEHKVFLGMTSLNEALDCWDQSYSGSMMQRRSVSTVSLPWLKQWLKTGSMREPISSQLSQRRAA